MLRRSQISLVKGSHTSCAPTLTISNLWYAYIMEISWMYQTMDALWPKLTEQVDFMG